MIFLKIKFQKKLQVSDQVHFKKKSQVSDQLTLVIFLTFFGKKYNDWIKGKIHKSETKWTGLLYDEHFLEIEVKTLKLCDRINAYLSYQ